MQYCLNLPNGGDCGDARTLAEFAVLAEDAGWDGVLLEDYIVYQNRQDIPTYDPWVALAAMALRTERIRLGTEVTPLARRRPWKLARETVTLDHLSGGRVILGAGLGLGSDLGFTNFYEETDDRQRASQLDEALDVLVGLWSGEPFNYTGQHYRVRELRFLPRPIQVPRIPIWIGGGFPNHGPMRRAARWDGACLYKATAAGSAEDSATGLAPADVHELKRFVAAHRTSTTPLEIVVGGRGRSAYWDSERVAIQALAEAGATWWIEWMPPSEPDVMRAAIERGPLRID